MRESTFTLVYWGFIPSFPTKGQLGKGWFGTGMHLLLMIWQLCSMFRLAALKSGASLELLKVCKTIQGKFNTAPVAWLLSFKPFGQQTPPPSDGLWWGSLNSCPINCGIHHRCSWTYLPVWSPWNMQNTVEVRPFWKAHRSAVWENRELHQRDLLTMLKVWSFQHLRCESVNSCWL